MIVIALAGIVVGVIACGFLGSANFWYTEEGVLKALQFTHPGVTAIRWSQRNIYNYSEVFVNEDGRPNAYLLDSNVLFNYTFYPKYGGE